MGPASIARVFGKFLEIISRPSMIPGPHELSEAGGPRSLPDPARDPWPEILPRCLPGKHGPEHGPGSSKLP